MSVDVETKARIAGRSRMPPPLPNLIGAVAGGVCQWFWPWPIGPYPWAIAGAALALAVAVWLIVGATRALAQHRTSADPADESTALVATGPFAFSRNPIYLALACLHLAIAGFFNSLWIAIALPPAMLAVDRIVVRGEERYLEAVFGRAYLDYCAKVRRWL